MHLHPWHTVHNPHLSFLLLLLKTHKPPGILCIVGESRPLHRRTDIDGWPGRRPKLAAVPVPGFHGATVGRLGISRCCIS